MSSLERARVLLSLQRALLGAITPEVRAIDVCWRDGEIRIRVAVESEPSEELLEIVDDFEAEVEADFIPRAMVRSTIEHSPVGTKIGPYFPFDGDTARVFARFEGY